MGYRCTIAFVALVPLFPCRQRECLPLTPHIGLLGSRQQGPVCFPMSAMTERPEVKLGPYGQPPCAAFGYARHWAAAAVIRGRPGKQRKAQESAPARMPVLGTGEKPAKRGGGPSVSACVLRLPAALLLDGTREPGPASLSPLAGGLYTKTSH